MENTPQVKLYKTSIGYKLSWWSKGENYQCPIKNMPEKDVKKIQHLLQGALYGHNPCPDIIRNRKCWKDYRKDTLPVQKDRCTDDYVEYLKMKARNYSHWPETVRIIFTKIREYRSDIMERGTTEDFQYILDIIAQDKSASTAQHYRAALSGYFRWKNGKKGYNPITEVKEYRIELRKEIVRLEEEEIKLMLQAADKRNDGLAIYLALLAGMRRSEIASLCWEDVTDTTIYIRKSKTGKQRFIPLSKRLLNKLNTERKKKGKVICWPKNYRGFESASRRLLSHHMAKELPEMYKRQMHKFSWNVLRHTFGSRLAEKGESLALISNWMGNTEKVCREHYIQCVPKQNRDTRIDVIDV